MGRLGSEAATTHSNMSGVGGYVRSGERYGCTLDELEPPSITSTAGVEFTFDCCVIHNRRADNGCRTDGL